MARFFSSLVTGRPLQVGGRPFIFEPVTPLGGGWLGVLAEADEASASILASDSDNVSEISQGEYDRLKKKRAGQATSPVSQPSPKLPPALQPLLPSVVLAESRTNSTSTEKVSEPAAAPEPSVSLKTTDQEPPPEPLLDLAPKKKRRSK